MEIVIHNKYIVEQKIGNGQFGSVLRGYNKKTREPVAIKLEMISSPIKLLKSETNILNYLYNQGCRSIPCVYWYGAYDKYMSLVMPLYECSLQEYCKKNVLTTEKISRIMLQCLQIIESIHEKYILHRDIKPDNFMVKEGELFLIDFGFSSFYVQDEKQHIPFSTYENIIGTPKFVSYHIHNGCEPSRRDDLISIGYIYLYLLYETLPWEKQREPSDTMGYTETHIQHPTNILRKNLKSLENLDKLYSESHPIFMNYIHYCYSIKFEEEPLYERIKQLFIKTI